MMGSGLKRTTLCRGGLAVCEEGFDNRRCFLQEIRPLAILCSHIERPMPIRQEHSEGKFARVAKFQAGAGLTGNEKERSHAAAGIDADHVTVFDGTGGLQVGVKLDTPCPVIMGVKEISGLDGGQVKPLQSRRSHGKDFLWADVSITAQGEKF